MCNILHSLFTLFLLGKIIFLSSLLSNSCSVCCLVSKSCFWPDCFLPFYPIHNNFIIHYHFQKPQQIHIKIHIKMSFIYSYLKVKFCSTFFRMKIYVVFSTGVAKRYLPSMTCWCRWPVCSSCHILMWLQTPIHRVLQQPRFALMTQL